MTSRAPSRRVRQLTEQGQDVHRAGAAGNRRLRPDRPAGSGASWSGQWTGSSQLEELGTLYDVVHDEVEGTALDVAAALRSVRRGNGMLGRVRRLLVPSR